MPESQMNVVTSYSVRLSLGQHESVILRDTVRKYREAVGWFIAVINGEWDMYIDCAGNQMAVGITEKLCIRTRKNASPKCDFAERFYKFPSYLRRAAIAQAYGLVSSYRSNLATWESRPVTERKKFRRPSAPKAGGVCPAMYKDNCFVRTGTYTARIKVWVRNTWDWMDVRLRKGDMDYILRRCASRRECVPTLRRRGKVWSLDFSFEEKMTLPGVADMHKTRILAVDLGINSACVCSVMESDGTVVGRRFLRLSKENDRLNHAVNRIKHAQQSGARHMPVLWAKADGINDDISVKTAAFIVDTAMMYGVDVVVMEALDVNGKKRGSKKQRLHLWKAKYVQSMVITKAHRAGIRVARVCARNTSCLAFDGSGNVLRGKELADTLKREQAVPATASLLSRGGKVSYSVCRFANGKIYNCDLNASYNIGARYYIREILRSQPERVRSVLEAKVPSVSKRSTCTLSDLKDLRAALAA